MFRKDTAYDVQRSMDWMDKVIARLKARKHKLPLEDQSRIITALDEKVQEVKDAIAENAPAEKFSLD